MNKQNRTKLQFILGGILFLTFAIAACNNGDDKDSKAAVKDSPATEMKPTIPPSTVDSGDSMEKIKGKVSPTPTGN
jgi:hypothetical protein